MQSPLVILWEIITEKRVRYARHFVIITEKFKSAELKAYGIFKRVRERIAWSTVCSYYSFILSISSRISCQQKISYLVENILFYSYCILCLGKAIAY